MSPWAIMNALVHSRHELGKIPGLENLPVRTATHLKTVTPPAGSRPRFRKHCVSIPSSHDGLVGFNSVLTCSPAQRRCGSWPGCYATHFSTIGLYRSAASSKVNAFVYLRTISKYSHLSSCWMSIHRRPSSGAT